MSKKKWGIQRIAIIMAILVVLVGCSGDKGKQASTTTGEANVEDKAAPEAAPKSFNETGYPIVNEPIRLTMMHGLNSARGEWKDLQYFKDMEKLTNVSFDFIGIAWENWVEKTNLALASGDYPDIFWSGMGINEEVKYGVETKVFQPVQDLIPKYMPHLTKVFENDPIAKNAVKAIDGNVYMLPYLADTLAMADSTLYYRKDWLAKVGKEVPRTVEELTDALKAFKTLGDDIVPLMPNSVEAMENFLYAAFGEDLVPGFVVDKNGKVQFSPLSEQFENYVTYMNMLFEEKLLDNELYTQTPEQATAKLKGNQAAVVTWGTGLTVDNFESGKLEVGLLAPLTSEHNSKQHVQRYSGLYLGYGIITDKNKYPEATLRFFDINYAEEEVSPGTGLHCLAAWLGPENVGFKYTNAEKTAYTRLKPADTKLSELEYTDKHWAPGTGPCRLFTMAVPENNPSQEMKASESLANWYPYMVPGFPNDQLRNSIEDQDRLATIWTDIESYYTQMKAKLITGHSPLTEFETFRSTIEKMGIDEVLQIKQRAYDNFLGK